jgi:hypothetical protein
MNAKQIGLSVVLAAFTLLTAEAVYQYGYVGFFEAALSNVAGVTLMVDLTISLGLVLLWMARDAKRVGMSVVPYAVLTLTLGSVGPLLYLIRREGRLAVEGRGHVRAAA